MPKQTKRNRKQSKTVKSHDYKCCDATFDGIHGWYKAMFEKLGWMILSKSKGMGEKTAHYTHSIERLRTAIIQKKENTHDIDKINDLDLWLIDVEVLLAHAKKAL
jgi:hypothetical protein